MTLNNLPKEIRDEPAVRESLDSLQSMFYGIIKDCVAQCLKGNEDAQKNDILRYAYNTMVANICKTAFDNAYMQYVTNGIMED